MQNSSRHVLIIGGGICGPTLGLFLNKAGISCTIYESYPYTQGIRGGFNLTPNGMYVLQALGLAETVIQKGMPVSVNHFKNDKGDTFATIKLESSGTELPSVNMSRSALYEILTEELKSKKIDIHYQKKLTSITHTENKVIAHFADGTHAEGDLLVGADGIHSTVRKHILPDAPEPKFTNLISVGGVSSVENLKHVSKEDVESMSLVFGAKGFFGYGGASPNTVVWWSNLVTPREYTREEMFSPDWEEVKQELLSIYKDFQPLITELISTTTMIMRVNIRDIDPLPTWYKDRIILIGDAAHAVSPSSGQGASLALEDAMMLAKLLRDNEDHMKAFQTFQDSRKERVEKISAEGRRRNSKGEVSPFQAKIREWMIRIFVKLFGAKGQRFMWDYKIDWEKKE